MYFLLYVIDDVILTRYSVVLMRHSFSRQSWRPSITSFSISIPKCTQKSKRSVRTKNLLLFFSWKLQLITVSGTCPSCADSHRLFLYTLDECEAASAVKGKLTCKFSTTKG